MEAQCKEVKDTLLETQRNVERTAQGSTRALTQVGAVNQEMLDRYHALERQLKEKDDTMAAFQRTLSQLMQEQQRATRELVANEVTKASEMMRARIIQEVRQSLLVQSSRMSDSPFKAAGEEKESKNSATTATVSSNISASALSVASTSATILTSASVSAPRADHEQREVDEYCFSLSPFRLRGGRGGGKLIPLEEQRKPLDMGEEEIFRRFQESNPYPNSSNPYPDAEQSARHGVRGAQAEARMENKEEKEAKRETKDFMHPERRQAVGRSVTPQLPEQGQGYPAITIAGFEEEPGKEHFTAVMEAIGLAGVKACQMNSKELRGGRFIIKALLLTSRDLERVLKNKHMLRGTDIFISRDYNTYQWRMVRQDLEEKDPTKRQEREEKEKRRKEAEAAELRERQERQRKQQVENKERERLQREQQDRDNALDRAPRTEGWKPICDALKRRQQETENRRVSGNRWGARGPPRGPPRGPLRGPPRGRGPLCRR
jgi:hypothetical protein